MSEATPVDDPVDPVVAEPEVVEAEVVFTPDEPVHVDEPVAPVEEAAAVPEKGSFIVLVETPANGQGNAIASTKGRAEYWMLDNDAKLEKRMEGRHRQFFYARHRSDREGIKLGKYAPYQEGW